jgi:hypothetical protein
MAILLVACGLTAAVIGGWRGYALARAALAPLVHEGEPTRTALEAARPIHSRFRVRLFARRVLAATGWLILALYGLYLAQVGSALP